MEPDQLEDVAARVEARAGAAPRLVAPLRAAGGHLRFLCALPGGAAPSGLAWLLVDAAGEPVGEARAVRQAAELVAMCETAEEAAAALAIDVALPILRRALVEARAVGHDASDIAAHAMLEALAGLERVEGVRVADAAYMDRVATAAQLVGDRFDLLRETAAGVTAALGGAPGDPLEALAEELWAAVRVLARDGAPDRFAATMEGALGVAAAFADDVVASYGVGLDAEEDAP